MARRHKKRKPEDSDSSSSSSSSSDSDNDNNLKPDLKPLINTLPQERLVELLKSAATRYSDVLADVRKSADKDLMARKLFVRGLSFETTKEALLKVFSKYGEIEEAVVVLDRKTQKCRGYGFVTFVQLESALKALTQPSQMIEGRMTYCHRSTEGADALKQNPEEFVVTHRKIYVANVPENTSFDKLHKFFSQYGEIIEGPLGFEKSGKSKGYSLIIYETLEGAKKALEEPIKTFEGVKLRCKPAEGGLNTVREAVANPNSANPLTAASTLSSGLLNGYGTSLDSFTLGLPLTQGLTSSYANLAGLGLSGSLNPPLYALHSSADPALATSLYPISSNSTAQGLSSGLGYGLYQPGGSAGLASLGAQSGGLSAYPSHLAAYAQLAAASHYSGIGAASQGIAISGSGVSPYSAANLGASSAEKAPSTGVYGSLGFY